MFNRLRNKLASKLVRLANAVRANPPGLVTKPVSVTETYESMITGPVGNVVESGKPAAWSPNQHGGVIVTEPDAVRIDRLRREREGKK